jgi:hypothetical protein
MKAHQYGMDIQRIGFVPPIDQSSNNCPFREKLVEEILKRQKAAELEEERPGYDIAGPLDKVKKRKEKK